MRLLSRRGAEFLRRGEKRVGRAQKRPPRDSLQEQLPKEKDPDKVQPTEAKAHNRDKNAHDKAKERRLLHPSGPSHQNFGDPVDTGNEEKEKLNETTLLIKPNHDKYLLIKYMGDPDLSIPYTKKKNQEVKQKFYY